MGDLLRMTWRKTKWVTHDMPSLNLSSIFDWKVTLKITIPPFKERGKVGGRRVWRFAQQLHNLCWNGFPHLRWNFFLGINMNFTIRVFTWGLGNYVKNPELKINIPIIKIVAKKTIDLIPTKPKTLLPKISKEHRIRFENNHNHVILITQKSVLLLHSFGSSIINWHLLLFHDM